MLFVSLFVSRSVRCVALVICRLNCAQNGLHRIGLVTARPGWVRFRCSNTHTLTRRTCTHARARLSTVNNRTTKAKLSQHCEHKWTGIAFILAIGQLPALFRVGPCPISECGENPSNASKVAYFFSHLVIRFYLVFNSVQFHQIDVMFVSLVVVLMLNRVICMFWQLSSPLVGTLCWFWSLKLRRLFCCVFVVRPQPTSVLCVCCLIFQHRVSSWYQILSSSLSKQSCTGRFPSYFTGCVRHNDH